MVTASLGLACSAYADDTSQYPKPIPPEIIKQIETPAKVSVDGAALRFDGVIVKEATAKVEQLLIADAGKSIRTMVIKSNGGEANAGIRFGELVRDWKLAVTVDGYCMSACANYVAIAARELVVPDGALLGYHGGPSRAWGGDGQYAVERREFLRRVGVPDEFIPGQLQRDKDTYARQQALFQSVNVSMAIVEDTQPNKIAPAYMWMFTRDAMERCYNLRNIKQYPALAMAEISQGKSTIKIMRDCVSKGP